MTPKRVVLLVEADAEARGVKVFLLETHGFRVFAAGSAAEAEALLAELPGAFFDVLVADARLPEAVALIAAVKQAVPQARALLFGWETGLPVGEAEAYLPKMEGANAVLLDRVKTLVVRTVGAAKRGECEKDVTRGRMHMRRLCRMRREGMSA